MIIKVLFAILVLSVAAVIGVAVAVFVLVRRHLKSRRPEMQITPELTQQQNPKSTS